MKFVSFVAITALILAAPVPSYAQSDQKIVMRCTSDMNGPHTRDYVIDLPDKTVSLTDNFDINGRSIIKTSTGLITQTAEDKLTWYFFSEEELRSEIDTLNQNTGQIVSQVTRQGEPAATFSESCQRQPGIGHAAATHSGPASAAPVVLECRISNLPNGVDPRHALYEIDYSARTVFQHYVDDDGAELNSSFHATFPISVTDEIITWDGGHQVGITEPDHYRLGRYSGTMTEEQLLGGFVDHVLRRHMNTYTCTPYTSPNQNRQRKF